MNLKRKAAVVAVLVISTTYFIVGASASPDKQDKTFREALGLYENGMYFQAKTIFDKISDPQAVGYSVLCDAVMKSKGYETLIGRYAAQYPSSGLLSKLYWQHAMNLFDEGEYGQSREYLSMIEQKSLGRKDFAEYLYKCAYCDFKAGKTEDAFFGFRRVDSFPLNDYSAPSRYAAGYILYDERNFSEALNWFEKSAKDPRFEEVSNYYIMECHYMMKDYAYVTEHGASMYEKVPQERKAHVARIISESYLVGGDAQSAKAYYDKTGGQGGKERGDYFYAGTLMYTVHDYQSAIDNYSLMTERTDSIGQVANYNMAYSYIQTKNKVAALQAFKDASQQEYDPELTEDAFYNYAKLSFDLNNDNSVFNKYLDKYSDKVKGNAVYAYMALSALYDHDYASAVAAYDKIDELDDDMKSNYMKANYLRAEQLISAQSWRNAIPCLKTAAYYSDKRSFFNQLSRYWLAESYYRNDQYDLSKSLFTELYNISALDGKTEGGLVPYNLAYCYFKQDDYLQASKWFDNYLSQRNPSQKRDALVRKADCVYATKDYLAAAEAYKAVVDGFGVEDDLYPCYQAGVSYGLADKVKEKIDVLSGVKDASPSATFFNDACYELGRAYVSQGDNGSAADCFERIVSLDSDKSFVAKSLLDLGSIARNQKQYDESLAYYKRVVSDMPESEYSHDALAAIEMLYQTKQEPESYVDYVESIGSSALTADIDKEELLYNAAEQTYLGGNWEKALLSLQNYQNRYPSGKYIAQTDFYLAETCRNMGKKDQAVDFYGKVLDSSDESFKEVSALNLARLSFEVNNYSKALEGYKILASVAKMPQNQHIAKLGMMKAAYMDKQYDDACVYADNLKSDKSSTDAEKLDATFVKAKSKLAVSERDEAMSLFKSISSKTSTAQGAEAAYMLIQDSSDKGDFEAVEKQVYAFSDSGSDQTYWLAKAFILLGDSFVEREDFKQARATFESVRDGYESQGSSDDVLDNVIMRLGKLDEMGK